MWGKATLAMLVSSTSMNVAIVTVSAMSQGLTARRGICRPASLVAGAAAVLMMMASRSVVVVDR